MTDREAWLAARREMVTASDAAAILGLDPHRGAYTVYAEKLGLYEPPDAPWMRRGRRFEAPIAEEYGETTGRPVFARDEYEIARHPDLPWLGATLDRETEGCEQLVAPAPGRGPLELKTVSGLKAREWRADPPRHYLVQLQVQIACTGAQWGSLAALLGGLTLTWVDVLRHDRILAAMLPKLEEFRLRVQRRDPPPADGLSSTASVLRAIYGEENGETVTLGAEAVDLADELDIARAKKGEAVAQERRAANRLKALLGAASFGQLEDGSYLSLRVVEREAYEVEETTYRTLRRHWPKLPRRA